VPFCSSHGHNDVTVKPSKHKDDLSGLFATYMDHFHVVLATSSDLFCGKA